MPEITIDGSKVEVDAGTSVLEAARGLKIFIPTLCHHPGLGAYGACRLCLVEVKAGFRPGLISSCTLPAMDELVVETNSAMVKDGRRLVAQLLLARAPRSRKIRAIAESLGVETTHLAQKDELCILCGRCVRACRALGVHAIAFSNRGPERKVDTPFQQSSETCMACQACVTVCPTGAVEAKIFPDRVEMETWRTSRELEQCERCRNHFATGGQRANVENTLPEGFQPRGNLCPKCRRIGTAQDVVSIPGAFHAKTLCIKPPKDRRI